MVVSTCVIPSNQDFKAILSYTVRSCFLSLFLVLFLVFSRQGFPVAMKLILELTQDQADLELTETLLPLPLKYWD